MALEDLLKEILSEDENVRKNGLPIETIEASLIMKGVQDTNRLREKANAILLREHKKKENGIFMKVRNPKTHKDKRGWYKIRPRKPSDPLPLPDKNADSIQNIDIDVPTTPVQQNISTNFQGKAGEYAVMSELLMNGYNANNMSVDEGVDIVACKNNVFYFIQVKTTSLNAQYKAYVQIQRKSFDQYISAQIRYVIAVRCGKGEYRFFKFSNANIEELICAGCIKQGKQFISIKIRFDQTTHLPYIYDTKEREIDYFQNNLDQPYF